MASDTKSAIFIAMLHPLSMHEANKQNVIDRRCGPCFGGSFVIET